MCPGVVRWSGDAHSGGEPSWLSSAGLADCSLQKQHGRAQGKAACIRIPFGKGVCGTAAQSGETQLVEDVHAFPGHIACDANSASELVVPVTRNGTVIAVIDLDSPTLNRFDAEDAKGVELLARMIADRI